MTTIEAKDAKFGEWYRSDSGRVIRCAVEHSDLGGTGFLDRVGLWVELTYFRCCQLEHMPDCDSFDWVDPKSEAVDVGEGYRKLGPEEIIADGDELSLDGSKWLTTVDLGLVVSGSPEFTYRRKIDYTLWQKPVGIGGRYPLPAGTEIEIDVAVSSAPWVATVSDVDPPARKANAIITKTPSSRATGEWVDGIAVFRWRVVPEPAKPANPAFEPGDWVIWKDIEGGVFQVTESDRMHTTASGIGMVPNDELIKANFRPFASEEEFKPHRDRWIRRKHGVGCWKPVGYTNGTVYTDSDNQFEFTELLEDYVFDDNGQPFGVAEVDQ
ncbi:MAG: hypothetical protein AAGJ40_09610 [Planctomycetota bacterium]